jgi:hypothetical protein
MAKNDELAGNGSQQKFIFRKFLINRSNGDLPTLLVANLMIISKINPEAQIL